MTEVNRALPRPPAFARTRAGSAELRDIDRAVVRDYRVTDDREGQGELLLHRWDERFVFATPQGEERFLIEMKLLGRISKRGMVNSQNPQTIGMALANGGRPRRTVRRRTHANKAV